MIKQISRDIWIAVLLLLVLAVLLFIAALREQQQHENPPLVAASNQLDGARALLLWMEELGYTVDSEVATDYAIPDGTELMLVLEPTVALRSAQSEQIDAWVEEGGILIVAGRSLPMVTWARHFRTPLRFEPVDPGVVLSQTVTIQTPLWRSPPQAEFPSHVGVDSTLATSRLRDDYIVHTAYGDAATVVVLPRGKGQVVLSSVVYPFTNLGLQQAGNPEFVLNTLALAGQPGPVWVDDWHHGLREPVVLQDQGVGVWLRTSTPGRALLLAGLLVFVTLLLRGRSFGRPVPPAEQRARRTPMEYVTAMANLQRRAHHRAALLQDYHDRLKRTYARRYHISSTQPDDPFVDEAARYDPTLDREGLATLLAALSDPQVSEEQMIRLAAEAADWIEHRSSQRSPHQKGSTHAN